MGKITDFEDFCGRSNTASLNQALREFFELAADMRQRLDEQGYLLEGHLRMLFAPVAAMPLFSTAEHGLNASASGLRELIRLAERSEQKEQPRSQFSEKVKAYVAEHPLPHQESYTRHSLYFAALFGDYMEYEEDRYGRELVEHIRQHTSLDVVRLREVRRDICDLLHDEEDMERLEELFRQCFLSVTPMTSFVRGMTDALLSEPTSRDEETSKLIFQLMLDANLASED